MELVPISKVSHKEWRRQAKKERRRKFRISQARARDSDAQRLNAVLLKDPDYLNWLETERRNEEAKAIEEAKEHDIQEQKWLEEEVRAQKEWRIQQDRKAKARQEQLDQEARIRKEFETKQEALRLKKEEARRREEEESKRHAELQREIEEYINEGTKTPEVLRAVTNTQPGKEPCPFFSKTGACRYGDTCSRNHQRVALSKVLLIPGFYSHFSMEKNTAEYDTDIALEFDGSEMRQHFREFYNDVVPELETFGRIKTLKYCYNTEIHLRGNMYVEYYTEREAARALRSLKGRWYAGRQLNCEFTNLKSWRNAVCGMQKCPKGRTCNFLHTIRNPRDEYDVRSPPRSRMRPGTSQDDRRFPLGATGSSRSSRVEQESSRSSGWQHQTSREESSTRNWRWSDSEDSAPESPSRSGRSKDRRGDRDGDRNSRRTRKRRRDSKKSRNGDEGVEDDAGIEQDRKSPRRKREGNSTSRSQAKGKKKKKRKDDEEAEDEEGRTKNRERENNRNDKNNRSAVKEEKRETRNEKDRSKKRSSLRKTSRKTERTKWDDPNCTTESESDSNHERSKRKRRTSRRSRTPTWSEIDANEAPESEEKKSKTPHR